jgi:hypothetical protein
MTSAEIASTTDAFITNFQSILADNISYVILLSAGVLVWFIMKKWVFGSARRI